MKTKTKPSKTSALNIIFDAPPGPKSGRFVEVENDQGHSVSPDDVGGEWYKRKDGLWALRVTQFPPAGKPAPIVNRKSSIVNPLPDPIAADRTGEELAERLSDAALEQISEELQRERLDAVRNAASLAPSDGERAGERGLSPEPSTFNLQPSTILEGVSNSSLDACRRAPGSAVLRRELLRRAIARGECEFARLSECLENIGGKLGRQKHELRYLDAAIQLGEVR